MTAPIRSMPELVAVADHGEVIAVVRRHQDIAEVWRVMKERLGLTNEFCDDAGGLTKGHTDKLLGPSESKNWGPTTFDLFCEMFAIEFRVHIDLDAAKRMQAVWEGRERPLYPEARVKRISKKLIERAKPYVFKATGKAGADARNAVLGPEQRSALASKAAKKRWRKWAKKMGRRGGKASARALSKRQRVKRAKTAANARWHGSKSIVPSAACAIS